MSVIGDVAAGVSSILGGRAQASAAKTEAVMLERQARQEEVRGKQIGAERRAQLVEALSTIDTIRASRGLSVDSPTGMAIRRSQIAQSEAVENADVLTSLQRESGIRAQASARRRAAPWIALSGYTRGLQHFGSAAEKAAQAGG